MLGDFNNNGMRDAGDLDLLAAQQQAADPDLSFDLTGDGLVNFEDRKFWTVDLSNTFIGDSNFDGEFGSGDFVTAFQKGLYESNQPATWEAGDWNGDGLFNSSDFVTAFQEGGYEVGIRDGGLQVVPEPSSILLALFGIAGFGFARRRK